MNKARANNITSGAVELPASSLFLSGATELYPAQDSSRQVTQSTLSHHAPPPVTLPANAGSDSATNSTNTQNNLLIINRTSEVDSIAAIECSNPQSYYQKCTLLKLAEFAYPRRDLLALEHIAAQLLSLPDEQAQSAGLYYSAIVAKRSGQERRAISLLESVSNDSFIRARAIQTLGAVEFDAGRHDAALPLFVEAARAAKGIDVAASLNALYQVSAIKSIAGDHKQALDDLLALWPIVRSVVKTHPHLYSNWHNDVAFELLHVGRIQEARESLSVALALPISASYPEYSETRTEIERCERKKIIVAVRRLKRAIITFRLCFIVKRRIITTDRLRLPVIKRTITRRVTLCARTHAPPLKTK